MEIKTCEVLNTMENLYNCLEGKLESLYDFLENYEVEEDTEQWYLPTDILDEVEECMNLFQLHTDYLDNFFKPIFKFDTVSFRNAYYLILGNAVFEDIEKLKEECKTIQQKLASEKNRFKEYCETKKAQFKELIEIVYSSPKIINEASLLTFINNMKVFWDKTRLNSELDFMLTAELRHNIMELYNI